MFMSSSGSFTWRSAWRTVSALSTAVVTDVSPPLANLATWNPAHQTVPPRRDLGVHPAGERQHAGNPKQRCQPALPGKEPEQLRDRIGPCVHAAVREHEMHGRGDRGQRGGTARGGARVARG